MGLPLIDVYRYAEEGAIKNDPSKIPFPIDRRGVQKLEIANYDIKFEIDLIREIRKLVDTPKLKEKRRFIGFILPRKEEMS